MATLGLGSFWPEHWASLRDRCVSNARFRKWAAAFPLTRPMARRRAAALFDICAGFVYSQVLLACVRLRVFDILAEGPQTVETLAPRFALSVDATRRLLEAAASLKLAERRRGGRYGLGDLGAAMIGNAGVEAMVEHHRLLYADLADPVALLRGQASPTRLESYWAYARSGHPQDLAPDQVGGYSALMSASQTLVAGEVLAAYSFAGHRSLLDVGGGEGTFLRAVAARHPHLRLTLFDLPAVAARAAARFAAEGLQDRATTVGGDFTRDALPGGADIVSLVRVVHDHDDEVVAALLTKVRQALPANGVLLLAEPLADTPGAEAMGAAYFGLYLLAMGSGRPRTFAELQACLEAAGFSSVSRVPTHQPLQTSLIVARA